MAGVAVEKRQDLQAAHLLGAAYELRGAIGVPRPLAEHTQYEEQMTTLRARLGKQKLQEAFRQGRHLTPEEITRQKDGQGGMPSTREACASLASASPLSRRELEVLGLLVQGLSNAQIAEQLVLSVVTVNSSLRSVYKKLGVTSRTQAMRVALLEH
jgi:ATP/maltotriose-dependent transcriptional regulator MalT